MDLINICRDYKLLSSEGIDIQVGSMHLQVRRISSGWGFRTTEVLQPYDGVLLTKENSTFQVSESGLYQTGKSDTLLIVPALPAKPVVLKNSGLKILPGQSMRFFVKIPLGLQFYFESVAPEHFISEFQLYRLSDTWFGDPDEGEPALALGNFFQKDVTLLDVKPWEAVCPVHISNLSNLLLEVERLIIRVENLALLIAGNQLITSLIEIEYKGREQVSSASYHLRKAVHGEDYRQVASPRHAGSKSSLMINFHFIKNIYPI